MRKESVNPPERPNLSKEKKRIKSGLLQFFLSKKKENAVHEEISVEKGSDRPETILFEDTAEYADKPLWQRAALITPLQEKEQAIAGVRERLRTPAGKNSLDSWQRLHELEQTLAVDVVSLHGVDREAVYVNTPSVSLDFDYNNTRIVLTSGNDMLTVKTYDAALSLDEQEAVNHRYESDIRPRKTQGAYLRNYLDSAGAPDILDEGADVIYANMDGITAQERQLAITSYNFQKKNNFRNITVTAPHLTWAIPIVMQLATAPFDEVYPIIEQGMLTIPEPGVFQSNSSRWVLNEEGNIATSEK